MFTPDCRPAALLLAAAFLIGTVCTRSFAECEGSNIDVCINLKPVGGSGGGKSATFTLGSHTFIIGANDPERAVTVALRAGTQHTATLTTTPGQGYFCAHAFIDFCCPRDTPDTGLPLELDVAEYGPTTDSATFRLDLPASSECAHPGRGTHEPSFSYAQSCTSCSASSSPSGPGPKSIPLPPSGQSPSFSPPALHSSFGMGAAPASAVAFPPLLSTCSAGTLPTSVRAAFAIRPQPGTTTQSDAGGLLSIDNGVTRATLTDLSPAGVELTFRRSAEAPTSEPVARYRCGVSYSQVGPGFFVYPYGPDGSTLWHDSYQFHASSTPTGLLTREVDGDEITEVTGVLEIINANPAVGPLAWTRTVVTERKRKVWSTGAEQLSGSTTETYSARPWGEALVRTESRGHDGTLLDRSDFTYDTATGRLLHEIKLDGSWSKYVYDPEGRVVRTLTPWLDSPASPAEATTANSRSETSVYDGPTLRVTQTQVFLPLGGNGRITSTTQHDMYQGESGSSIFFETVQGDGTWEPASSWDQPSAPNRRVSGTWRTAPPGFLTSGYFPERAFSSPDASISPDNLVTLTSTTQGTLTVTPTPSEPPTVSFQPYIGPYRKTVTTQANQLTAPGPHLSTSVTPLSTRDTTYSGIHGIRYRTREVFANDDFVLTDWWLHEQDADGHETSVTHNSRLVREATWANDRLASETDEEGRTTSYTYFPDGQVHTATTLGGDGVPDTVVTHAYTAGNLISRTTTAGSLSRTESWSYGPDGKLLSHTDADGFVHPEPVVVEDIPNRTVSTTDPAGRTTVTTRYRDGRLKSVTGPGLLDEHYTYAVTPEGHLSTTIRYGAPDSPRFLTRIENGLGELLSESRSTFGGAAPVTVSRTLDFAGRPVAEDVPGAARLLHAYSPDTGRLFRSAHDLDANGQIGLASADRVSETRESFVRDTPGGPVFRLTESLAYLQPGDATPTVLGSVREQLSGFTGTVVARRTVTDAHGQPTVFTTSIDRATRTRTESVQRPGVASPESRVFVHGRLVSESVPGRSQDVVRTYDALGRLATVSDPVTGTTTYHYRGTGDLLDSVEDQLGRHTRYAYHPAGTPFAGLLRSVTNPAGETVTHTYDLDRRQVTESGTGTYPVSRLYDEEGRLVALNTYRAGPTTPDTTHWHHDPASGLLRAKEYADGTAVHYTYDTAGRLATRTWARGVRTSYGYDPASGDLASITYSDGTPTVSFTRDRLGRLAGVTDAAGTQTFTLDPAGDLLAHAYTAGPLAGVTLTVGRDALGRRSGLSVTRGATTLHAVTEGYDDTSRLSTHTFGSRTITYGYDPARGLRTETRFPSGVTTATAYDPAGRISSVLSAKDGHVLAGRTYPEFDGADRRTRIESPDGSAWTYAYNKRGEVIRGEKQDPADNLLDGHRFTYQYDHIGNRSTATLGAPNLTAAYTANQVNQYTQVLSPQADFVRGAAPGAQTVTVNGQAVPLAPDGTFNARVTANGPVQIQATAADGSTSTETRTVTLPPASFAPVHDADGNLLNDGLWTYTWDGENRLVALETNPANPIPQPIHKRFTYDFQSRRVAEERYLREQPTGPYVLEKAIRWINDGWNQTVELLNDRPIRAYVWGLDLSGTREGAGGVGGLLSSVDLLDGSAWDYVSDGNGNVVALADGATADVVGRYDYGPFGEELAVDGPMARVNRFRFSSKMGDLDTGLEYYGYRYLDTRTGRWVNRDPIEEAGGLPLLGFVGNNPIQSHDRLGLAWPSIERHPTDPPPPSTSPTVWDHFGGPVGDQTPWFEDNFPGLVTEALRRGKRSAERTARNHRCKLQSPIYNEDGYTILAVKPSKNTYTIGRKLPGEIYDYDFGDKPQSRYQAVAELGHFSFRIAPQTFNFKPCSGLRIEGKKCCRDYCFTVRVEVRDVLGHDKIKLSRRATRGGWEVDAMVSCCNNLK